MINQFETIASRIPEILNRISSATFANQAFDVTKPLPYHLIETPISPLLSPALARENASTITRTKS